MRKEKICCNLVFQPTTAPALFYDLIDIEKSLVESTAMREDLDMMPPRYFPKQLGHFQLVTKLVAFFFHLNLVSNLLTKFFTSLVKI